MQTRGHTGSRPAVLVCVWLARVAKDSSLRACAVAAYLLQPGPALLFPSPAVRAEHCGTQTKCPQTGWSETSGYGPHARCGGSLPASPPLPSVPFPFPTPPRRASASGRAPSATAPNGRPRVAGWAPRSSSQAHGRRALPSRLALSHLAGALVSGAAMRAQFQAAHWPRRGGPR